MLVRCDLRDQVNRENYIIIALFTEKDSLHTSLNAFNEQHSKQRDQNRIQLLKEFHFSEVEKIRVSLNYFLM